MMLRTSKAFSSSLPWAQLLRECPISTNRSSSGQLPSRISSRIQEGPLGPSMVWEASKPMMSREDLTDSGIVVDRKVSSKNSYNASLNTSRSAVGRLVGKSLTHLELEKSGMDPKNFSSASSSFREFNVDCRIRASISDDCFKEIFSTGPRTSSKSHSETLQVLNLKRSAKVE